MTQKPANGDVCLLPMNNKIGRQRRKVHSPRRVGWIAAALIAVMALLSVATSAEAAWYNSSWQYRKKLTIDYTRVGAMLSNFPVLVSLASDTDLAADAQDDGDDILFTSSDGATKLDHEIEYFSGTTGQLVAWVKILSLSNTADTEIYMYYGNGSATSQQNATGVWDDGGYNYYKGVWHLGPSLSDSTSYGNNGTDNNGTTDAVGKIANARDFENYTTANNQYISVGHSASLSIPDYLTVEAWVRPESIGFWQTIVSKVRSDTLLDLYLVLDTDTMYLAVYPLGDGDTGITVSAGSWQHVAFTYDGSYSRLYLNGSDAGSSGPDAQTLGLGSNTQSLYMGYNTLWPNELWDGMIDEVRISRTARSPQWMSTQFNNQNNPTPGTGTFFKSLGSEETNLEQEGFRFRYDNGDEDEASWLANQDTDIFRDKNLNTRLRVIVNATGDPSSTQYQLEYKKVADSSWQKVDVAPSQTVSIITTTGAGTWQAPPNVTSVTVETWGGGGAGGGLTGAIGRAGGGGGGAYSRRTFTVTPGNTYNYSVAATATGGTGDGPAGNPTWFMSNDSNGCVAVGGSGGLAAGTGGAGGQAASGFGDVKYSGGTGGTSDATWSGGGAGGAGSTGPGGNANVGTAGTGTSEYGGNGGAGRNTTGVGNAGSVYSGAGGGACRTTAGGSRAGGAGAAGQIRLTYTPNPPIVLSLSTYFADGDSTTAQLTPPSGKTTGDFTAGRIQESTNPAAAVDIANNYYTELEWSLIATDAAQYGGVYQFRVTANGVPLTTYTVTPQWTIGTPPANLDQVHYRWRNDNAGESANTIQVSATGDTTTGSATDVLVDSMTITPGTGDYHIWFSGSIECTTTSYQYVSLYLDGVQLAHTERQIYTHPIIWGQSFPVATHARVTGVTAGQAIEVRWRTTAGTATMHERTLAVTPIVAADTTQASATADTTTESTTDVLVDSMTITPGAGDYHIWFSGSAENTTTAYIYVSLYVNGVQLAHTERLIDEDSDIPNTSFPVATHARVTGVTAGQAIEVRWRTTAGTATMHERTLVVSKITAANSTQASATEDTTTGSLTDVLVDSMTITPGAGDYRVWFSGSAENSAVYTFYVSLYVNGVQLAHTERQIDTDGQLAYTSFPVATHAYVTGVGDGQAIEVRWRKDSSGTLTMHQRTLLVEKVSASTWAANEDAKLIGLGKGTPKRIRLEVSNEGGSSSGGVTYQLQVAQTSTCSSGTYSAVPTDTSGHWQIVGSTYITDGEATSNIASGLTDESTTFVAGQLKDAGNTTGSITLNANQFTEIEFAVQATTSATDGADYCFRLYNTTGGTVLNTYDKYAEVTLAGGVAWWDGNYGARKKITVTAGSAALPSGYSVTFTFNHAGLVSGGKSLASGNDARVVYWNGSSWLELDRSLDEFSSWNNTSTTIWFRTQAAISAGSSDDNYYLYYWNPSVGSPPANKSNVFDLWDDFLNGSDPPTGWTEWKDDTDPPGVSSVVSSGIVTIVPGSTGLGLVAGIKHDTYSPGNTYGFAARTRSRAVAYVDDDHAPICWFINAPSGQTYCYETRNGRNRYDLKPSGSGDTTVQADTTTGPWPVADTWYIYEVQRRTAGDIRALRENTQQFPPAGGWSTADTSNTSGGFGLGGEATGSQTYQFDWVWARKLVDSEPSSSSGGEESPTTTLTLANHASGQVSDKFTTTSPVTDTLFQFKFSRLGTVTVSAIRVGFTTSGGVANGDVSDGELWKDDGDGVFEGVGQDTQLKDNVTPSSGVLNFDSLTEDPGTSGTTYFVRATVSNLAAGDTTTFSLVAGGIDEAQGGVTEFGLIAEATHTQDSLANLNQIHYRWRNDNGGESANTIQVSATDNPTTTSTSDVLVSGMTITPGAGDYHIWFSGSVEAAATSYQYVSLYVNGVQLAHTERQIYTEDSIPATSFPVATHAKVTGVTAGQAIEVRWRTSTSTATMHERTLVVTPIVAADSTQASATGVTTTTSTSDVLVSGMTITPGAGDYHIWFSGSVEAAATSYQYVSLYVNGVQLAHTERQIYTEDSIPATSFPVATHAKVTGVTAGQAIEVRWRTSTSTATMYERTLVVSKINAANSTQASATVDTTTTSTSDVLVDGMTITPGAGDYLIWFSGSIECANGATTYNQYVSLYVNGAQVAHTERQITEEESIPSTAFPVATHAYVTGVGAGQAIDVRWRTTGGTATMHERTLVVEKVSASTWAANEDAKLTGLAKSTPKRVRLEVSNEGGLSSGGVTYQLQVAQTSTCSSGAYSAVPTDTSGHWQIVGSSYITDGEATSNIAGGLTDESTTFVAGQLKDAGNTTGSITLSGNEFTEIEFAVQATTSATNGANYCFRLYNATGGAPLNAYSKYAEATLASPGSGTLLTFDSKYVVTSATADTNNLTSLKDDAYASQTFNLTASKTVLVIYQANNLYGTAIQHTGMQNAIWVDSADYANTWDSPFNSTYVARNTVFWIGTLGSGSHTITGRFASNTSGQTATLSNRVLLIYVLNGDAYRYVDSATSDTNNTTVFKDDTAATFTFTPPGSCKALMLYNVANSTGATETGKGKKAAINVGGTDYSQAEKSPAESGDADSVFTLWAGSLSVGSTTVTGRFAASEAGGTVTVNRRQLGVLMFDDTTLLDNVSSDTQVLTTSSSLVDDGEATINRTTTDARELLVVAMGTKRLGTVSSNEGECYGIMVNGNDRANSRGSNSWSSATSGDGPGSEATAWAETLAAGSHTIKGRFSNNTGTTTAKINSRRIAALWLGGSSPPPSSSTLYRSVGTNASDLNTGRTVEIFETTATFSGSMPNNIGVGDVLQYDSGGLQLAFIHGRASDTVYMVKSASGGNPQAAVAGTSVNVYRAYTSLANWQSQTQNLNITAGNINPNKDLLAGNTIMNVACYGDGVDTAQVVIDGWTTGANNYIKIYTPVSSSEVGLSQRHNGKWDDSKYRLEAAERGIRIGNATAGAGNVWIDGLQVYLPSASNDGRSTILVNQTTAADHRISNNILKGSMSSPYWTFGIYLIGGSSGSVARIWNNIIYDFYDPTLTKGYGIDVLVANFTSYLYNNTVYNCRIGLSGDATSTVIAKNNISYNNYDNYNDTFDGSSTNNLSGPGSDGQIPPTGARNGVPVTFVDPNGSPRDLHLVLSDTGAKNYGASLSSDANLAFSNDIDGQTRSGAWDIGADENVEPPFEYRRPITINFSERGSSCTGPLSDYPVLISLSGDWLKTRTYGGKIYNSDGYDIMFRDANLNPLNHEIEDYDDVNGKLVAWVRIPKLFENNQDTIIYIDYGSSSITSPTESPASVWNSNYVGVWHLKEDPSGGAPQMKDSTSNANNGTSYGSMTSGDQVAGKIDGSLDLKGTDDRISVGSIVGNSTAFTVSLWFKTTSTNSPMKIWGEGNTGSNNPFVYLDANEVTVGDVEFAIRDDVGTGAGITISGSFNNGNWHQLVGVQRAKNDREFFVDGISRGTDTTTIGTATLNAGNIGAMQRTSIDQFFTGGVDEVRISNIARDACWIETTHSNQKEGSSLTTVGSEIVLGQFENRKQITLNVSQRGSSCTGSLSNFPVLIDLSGDWLKTKANGGYIYSSYGHDIIFRDLNNNQLDHEIEKYDGSSTSVTNTFLISENDRDAWEDGSTTSLNEAHFGDLNWYDTGGYQFAATIPQGATITSARLRLYFFGHTGTATYTARIRVEDVDNASAFKAEEDNIRSRTYWTTTVDWNIPAAGLPVGWNSSPDLTNLIQHIVNRAGWTSGNYLNIAVWGQTGATGGADEDIYDYFQNSSLAARLEVTYLDPFAGQVVAWVRIPTLFENNQDTVIYMYYGNANITSPTENPSGVYDNNYRGVWHLKEKGNGSLDEFKDSSPYANHGQGGKGNSLYVPTQVGGKVSYGQDFNNSDGKYDLVDVGNKDSILDLAVPGNQITLEAWVQHNVSSPFPRTTYGILNHKGWFNGYSLLMETDGYGCSPLCLHFNVGKQSSFLGTATLLTAGMWHHVVATYDGALMKVFIDGVQDANTLANTDNLTAPSPPEHEIWIGHGDQPTDATWSAEWEGQIDEVRISNVARDKCWIETQYKNQDSPSTFASIGTGEEFDYKYRKQITILDSMTPTGCTSDLTDFPVLINLTGDWLKTVANGGNINHPYGYDIIFKAQDGETKLDHEIEYYSGGISVSRIDGSWSNAGGAAADPLTVGPYTVPSGKNRLLVFVTGFEDNSTNDPEILGVTYGGKAMTRARKEQNDTGNNESQVEIWYLKEADIPSGSNSFVIDYTMATPNRAAHHAWATFADVDQTNPLVGSNGSNGTDPVQATITTVAKGMSVAGAINATGGGSYDWNTLQNGWIETSDVTRTYLDQSTMSTAEHAAAGISDTATADYSYASTAQALAVASFRPSLEGRLVAWVRIPTLLRNANTIIYMYYGNPEVTAPTANPTGVWDSNYAAVWHLKEKTGGTGAIKNSTSYSNDGTNSTALSLGAAGKMDGAMYFDGAGDYVTIQNPTNTDPANQLTVSAWVKADASTHHGEVVSRGDSYAIRVWDAGDVYVYKYNGSTWINMKPDGVNVKDGQFHNIVFRQDATGMYLFLDGLQIDYLNNTTPIAYTQGPTVEIGRHGNGNPGYDFSGIIDEVRISTVGRSDCWIGTEYNNLSSSSPGTYYTVEGEQELTFNHRKQITLLNSMTPDSCSGNLTNFPVHISLSGNWLKTAPNGDIYSANGYDIIFRAQDGVTKLDHEIEDYNGSAGTLVAWVRIPTLLYNADTIIYMYYGNSTITTSQANPTGVWSEGGDNHYKGVWHLQETSGSYLDSTGNNNAGAATVTSRTATAKIGTYAPQFDSATNNNINCGTGSTLDFSGDMTLEAWIYPTGWGEGGFGAIVERGAEPSDGYEFYVRQASTSLAIYDGTSLAGNVGSITLNTWQHVVVVVTGGITATFYVNGVSAGSGSWDFAAGGSATFYIGTFSDMLDTFGGTIDEVRASNVARSACWIGTEYTNQSSPLASYTIEGEESDYKYRRQITIKNSMTPDASCSTDLTNYPALISLENQNWLKTLPTGDITSANGYDIIFKAEDGETKLDHEIEKYSGTAGTLLAWVRIPTLKVSADTIIYMYYGNSTITSPTANPTAVWNSNYKAVYHLKETSGKHYDSTSNANHSTSVTVATQGSATGQIDGADDFNGSSNNIVVGDSSSLDITSAVTIEAWVNPDTLTGSHRIVVKDAAGGSESYVLRARNGDDLEGYLSEGGTFRYARKADILTTGGYQHVVLTWDGGSADKLLRLYYNGSEVSGYAVQESATAITPSADSLYLGSNDAPGEYFDGRIDEVRISNVARDACWIGTSYNNQDSPSTHISVEGVENLDYNYRQLITISDSMTPASCTSNLTNYPVLISLSGNWLKTVGNGGNISSQYGYDIIFRDENGLAKLDHEIEDYNGSAGTLLAWVRIPTLHFNDSTNIYIYYGNSAITSPTANAAGVWGSNYKGVWHLKETGSGAAGEYKDSTQYTNHGQGGGGTAGYVPSLWTGTKIIDGAQDFDGTDDYLDVGSGSSIDDIFASGGTVSAWIYPRGWGGNNVGRIAGKASDTSSNNGWSFLVNNSSCSGCLQLAKGFTTAEGYWNTPNSSISLNQWQYVVVSYDHSSAANDPTLYINGVAQAITEIYTPSGTAESDAAQNMHIGNFTTIRTFNGAIDEVRIETVARDACWIGTEYNNQNSPTTYVALGSEQGFAPTVVKLSSFKATRYPEGTLLEWRSGYEVDNLGFHVYREEKGHLVRLTPEPVAGSALLAGSRLALRAGHHYSWWDFPALSPQSSSLSPVRYWLKDIDLGGKETMHGPVTPVISREPIPQKFRPELLSELGMKLEERYHHYWKVRELKEKLAQRRLEVRGAPRGRGLRSGNKVSLRSGPTGLEGRGFHRRPDSSANEVQKYLAGKSAVKLFVREEGWYQVSQPELVAAGLSPRVNPRYLQLFVEGREQPIHVIGGKDGRFGPQDAIEFYGVGLDTPSTDTRVYWLVEGSKPGKRIHGSKSYSGSLGSLSSSSFPYTVEKKDRWIYLPAIKNGEEENFFGSVIYGGRVDQVLEVKHLDVATSEDALLEVALQGATTGAHRVKVYLNDEKEEVGEIVFEGQTRGFVSLPVSQSELEEGENLVSLEAQGGGMDVSLVDTVRLTYWHSYTADDNGLRFRARGGSWVSIDGFSQSDIRVFDITDSNEVIEVIGRVESQKGSYVVGFRVPGHGERTLLAMAEDGVKNPVEIVSDHPSAWHQEKGGYGLLIISHREFFHSLQHLIKLRESQGYKVALIDVEDIYDEFSFGNKSPKAIKDFLASAKANWSQAPRFVLLVGDASFDPRNYLGMGDLDLVPTKLIDTPYMETASDDWFVDSNNDGLPEMAIGRLPVQTAKEAATVVSKIVGYEKSSKKREAILVSDINDGFDFEGASEEIGALLPSSMRVRKIYRGEFSSDDQARAELLSGINQGPLLVNFIGHGSIEIWRGIFSSDDAENLLNKTLPFFVNMTCLNGYFQDPYYETLAESLLKSQSGGAVAIWTSSGLTEPDQQAVMNKELIKLLFGRESLTLGEATVRAKAFVSDQDIRKTWILFGDPTTRLRP